jgi:hypothetical protein
MTMMIRWILTAQGDDERKIIELRRIPYSNRLQNKLLLDTVNCIKEKWAKGTQIEKLAVIGWNDNDVCKLLTDVLENYDSLRSQFNQHTSIYGSPSEITDNNLELYEKVINEEIKML